MNDLKELETIKHDLVSLERDAKGLAQLLGRRGKEKLEGARMRVWNATRDMEQRAAKGMHDAYDFARREGHRRVSMARKGIEHRPLSSVGVALLAGLVFGTILGYLFGRRD